MDIVRDAVVGLLTGAIGFVASRIWTDARWFARSRRARQFWSVFRAPGSIIVIGRFWDFRLFEPSGFMGVGDAMGLEELKAHLKSVGVGTLSVIYADQLDGEKLDANLILIGGPDANSLAKDVVERIAPGFRFGNAENHKIAIRDDRTGMLYRPELEAGSQAVLLDYGIIARTANPLSPSKSVLLVAGSFGFGTWAALRYVMSKSFLEDPLVRTGRPVECLIETDVLRASPQAIRRVVLRELGNRPKA